MPIVSSQSVGVSRAFTASYLRGKCLWATEISGGCRRLQASKKLFGEERQTSSGFHVWVTHGGPSSRAGSQFVKPLDHSPFGTPAWCGIGSGHGVMLHAKLAAEL